MAFFLLSCGSKPNKPTEKESGDSLKMTTTVSNQSVIFIKDKSQYDGLFVEGLSGTKDSIRLVDNCIVVGGDTTFFPENLPLNKAVVFKAQTDDTIYQLRVTRTNFTNLAYDFKLSGNSGKVLYTKSGKAVLGSSFYLSSEMDEDSEKGGGYPSAEYWDKTNDCWFAIRIELDAESNEKQRAKLVYGCEDKSKPSLALNECPVLRTE